MPTPMPFAENGVTVNFPDANHFRLSDCQAYRTISSRRVKEMDIGWYDANANTLWLVEMKAYYNPANPGHRPKDLSDQNIVGNILEELAAKSIHTICQLTTDRAGTKSCVAQPITDETAINLVHLIRVMPGQDAYLNPLQDAIRAKLMPYIAIYNIAAVTIISYDYAVANQLISWIV